MANYTVNQPYTVPQIKAELDKISTAIASHLDRNPEVGQANQMQAEIDMNGNKITNLAQGTAGSDAVNKDQLDTEIATVSISSIAHIDEYINPPDGSGPIADDVALLNASNAVETVVFGGTSLTLENDVTIPSTAVCTNWDLQGSTFNLINNSQITIQKDNFILENGIVDGNLITATVTVESSSTPTTLTVDNPSAWSVNDQIASSWSNGYLPNSASRITAPNTDFNRVIGISGSALTLDYAVTSTLSNGGTNTIPAGARVFNARFDKETIVFQGSGNYLIRGMEFVDCPNAYFIEVRDTTESARAIIQNCRFSGMPLDNFKFQADTITFYECFVDTPLDIAKQTIVWANTTKEGKLGIHNTVMNNSSRDSFLYVFADGNSVGYAPEIHCTNSTFDGTPTLTFTPNQVYSDARPLHWVSSDSSATSWEHGRFQADNCNFIKHERSILGTTFVDLDNFTQKEVMFNNCFVEGTPVVVQGNNSSVSPVEINNCEVRHSGQISFVFMEGCPQWVMNGGLLRDSFPESGTFTESSNTTTQAYFSGDYIERTDTGRRYYCYDVDGTTIGDLLSDDTKFLEVSIFIRDGVLQDTLIQDRIFFDGVDLYLDRIRFSYDTASLERKPVIQNFRQGKLYSSFVLTGYDNTSATAPNTDDFFLINIDPDNKSELDLPAIRIHIESSDAIFEYGGNESSTEEYHTIYKALRSDPSFGDTSPYDHIGAFLYKPYERSIVEFTRDRTLKQITQVEDVTLTAGTSGASTITFSAISGGATANKGDWLSLNVSGENRVRFHEITNVSGSTLTITPTLDFDYTSSDNSCLLKHDWLYGSPQGNVEIVITTSDSFTTTGAWTTISNYDSENYNTITYCTTNLSSGSITLPRGKYEVEGSASWKHQTSATATTSMQTAIRIRSANSSFTTIRSTMCRDISDDSGTPTQGRLTTQNFVTGNFELTDEDTITLEYYTDVPIENTNISDNFRGTSFRITKVG